MAIFEEIFENIENAQFKAKVLEKSGLLGKLAYMSETATIKTEKLENLIRNGNMALVTKIANLVIKYADKAEVEGAINAAGDRWQDFVEGDLNQINELNRRDLGGQSQQTRQSFDDDETETNHNMEQFMARFNQQPSGSQDEPEEAPMTEIKRVGSSETILDKRIVEISEEKLQQQPLNNECLDNNFWKVSMGYSLDELLTEADRDN